MLVQDSQWVINRKFDTIFFLGSILLGITYFFLLLLIPQHALLITAIVWVLFAQAHFGSTWFIYFDKRNLQYFRQHAFIYYVMPIIIFIVVIALGYYNQIFLAALISIVSIYHVTKQNLGVLQLYRVRNKEFDVKIRRTENTAIFAWTLLFGGAGALYLPNFRDLLGAFLPLAKISLAVLAIIAIVATLMIIRQYRRRERNSLPKTIFLIESILMYSPYIYAAVILVDIYQMEIATLTSLIAHYMQYMGLVWLINRNKYQEPTSYAQENSILRFVTRKYWYIAAAILSYALLMAFFRWAVPYANSDILVRTVPNIVLALTAIHFYIDSFIWRFRNPFYKETVIPFIKPLQTQAAQIK